MSMQNHVLLPFHTNVYRRKYSICQPLHLQHNW